MTDTLKETHPQKYYLRLISRLMFYFGLGTYWYEGSSTRYPRLYAAWCIVIQSYMFIIVLDIFLAIMRPDLRDEEKFEAIQIGFSQVLNLIKFIIVIFQRHRICKGFKKLLEEGRDIFISLDVEKRSVRTAKIFFLPFMCMGCSYVGGTFVRWTFVSILKVPQQVMERAMLEVILMESGNEGIGQRTMISDIAQYQCKMAVGTPIQTQVTYFPTPAHTGFPYNILRLLILVHWWLQFIMITTSDCLCSLPIFFVAAKFKEVQMYFENLGENDLQHWSGNDFKKAVINGIKLHRNALWCASNIQSAMGALYGIQILQTVVLVGISLYQLTLQEKTVSNLLSEAALIVCVSLLTAVYMINSGVITYEAAAVATSIFHCGWQHVPMDKSLRTLLVVAIQQAQIPVYMTAFGMLRLSHESFVKVLRAGYSFFALFY